MFVVKSFLSPWLSPDVRVFTIGAVEVPAELLMESESGEKGRILALARTVDVELGVAAPVRFVVDNDYDLLWGLPRERYPMTVLRTDVSSLEMFFFDAAILDRVLSRFCQVEGLDASTLLEELGSALRVASCMFAGSERLALGCHHVPFDRSCSFSRSKGLVFKPEHYMNRYLNASAAMANKAELEAEIRRIETIAPEDPRLWVRGRDYVDLLIFVLGKLRVDREVRSFRTVSRALFLTGDSSYLSQFELFRSLREWTSSG